jgi:hypothetical protein
MAGVRAYLCPDGKTVSLYSDRRDCPLATSSVALGAGGTRTRFLGARGFYITEEQAADLRHAPAATPKPLPLDIGRLLLRGAAVALAAWIILLLLRRRKRRGTRR